MRSELLLKLALCAYVAGALGSLGALRREKLANLLGFGFPLLGGILGLTAALSELLTGAGHQPAGFELWPSLIPYVRLAVRLDALGAFFLLIASLLAVGLSVYSFGYVRSFYGRKNIGVLGAFYNSLLLALTLVFTAGNAFFFLIVWEIMALTAYCLVSFEHEKVETRN